MTRAKKKPAATVPHRIYVSLPGQNRTGYVQAHPHPHSGRPLTRDGGLTLDPAKALVLGSMDDVEREMTALGLIASGEREERHGGYVVFCRMEVAAPRVAAATSTPAEADHSLAVLRFHVEGAERDVLADASRVAKRLRECADIIDAAVVHKDVYRLSQSNMYLFGPNDVPVLRERAAIVDVKRRVLDLLDGKKDVRL